jgi:glyoxylase-like metal-dependent hydrolase (beta-lactamase superfamily II)
LNRDPLIQVHEYSPGTWILRQNMCVHYEAPFLYLLVGDQRAFLQDTGATSDVDRFPLRTTVDQLISKWPSSYGRKSFELVVTHSHGHGDHTAADPQFSDRPDTTLVPAGVSSVREFFGIESWPDDIVTFDLGGRELDIIPLPGHISDHIAVFDRQTGILLTGDTLYPGNLYIQNWQHFKESIRRLVDFAQTRTISHVLGTHIEMTNRAGIAFDFQSTYHPEEHELQLSVDHLSELDRALASMGEDPVLEVHDDFVIVP